MGRKGETIKNEIVDLERPHRDPPTRFTRKWENHQEEGGGE